MRKRRSSAACLSRPRASSRLTRPTRTPREPKPHGESGVSLSTDWRALCKTPPLSTIAPSLRSCAGWSRRARATNRSPRTRVISSRTSWTKMTVMQRTRTPTSPSACCRPRLAMRASLGCSCSSRLRWRIRSDLPCSGLTFAPTSCASSAPLAGLRVPWRRRASACCACHSLFFGRALPVSQMMLPRSCDPSCATRVISRQESGRSYATR
mmetsp:Transcript_18882/g.54146  ORF Transcript_18882/g.54146 Transcript_18882/m.54146 type:complete len:210 (+) Transcript_18882:278-907(+)